MYRLLGPAITTVDPNKLTSDCFRDFSGLKIFSLHFQEGDSSSSQSMLWRRRYLSYRRNGSQDSVPSPPGTHGFFYYCAPPSWAHDLAGEIRFRTTKDSDPSSFASGHDLLVQGMPWTVTLFFNTSVSAAFLNILQRDGLLSEDQIRRLGRLEPWRSPLTAKSRLIHSIGQPFAIPISANPNRCKFSRTRYLVPGIMDGRDVLESFHVFSRTRSQWGYDAGPDGTKVFSKDAIAIVHLEPWVHPRFKKRYVALRVRRLLTFDGLPVNSPDDHPDHGAAGHLLRNIGRERMRVWHHDLDRGPVAWRYLRLPPEGMTVDL
ncbi:uncharacterized protein PHACADRAFT_246161 [Phanerochaete carnosa HHB-10118-sp]|uniref:Uncharacterized protein n=1 Tax=Phanerochaete carnosa (strain HHB-10118-sp) TaxID=650164 RepID=K5W8R8_PHACS|nr:uncharacterized protein PHACADRAFT_246161 [Phanerochaete carnosa HHB-10118-sp]EKM60298.1 hypothetical protein PHACADRAFT_246161 [Phanerochaete carnosa HHB-10118-sp]